MILNTQTERVGIRDRVKVLIILNQVQVHGFFGDKKMGLLNTMQQAQPQSGLLSGMGMQQPQNPRETEVAKQLATALFQNPTAETVQAVVAKMTQMQMAGTEEIGKILTSIQDNPEALKSFAQKTLETI